MSVRDRISIAVLLTIILVMAGCVISIALEERKNRRG